MSKKLVGFCIVLALVSTAQTAFAMHIMEGFLPPVYCIAWGAISLPFVAIGVRKASKLVASNQQAIVLLAMAGAFTFVLSALKIPSVTGSSSHMTGLGFAAIMFGPSIASLLALIVLLFQALLLAHGGLTILGANTFSMGIAGPLLAYFVFLALSNAGIPKKFNIFLAAALGDLLTYVVTSIQLAMAWPSEVGGVMASFTKFAGIFAVTQVPLAVIEGILTVILVNFVMNYGRDSFKAIGKDVLAYE